ncbi:MAG: helix-turn-helix transcriptional regulator [Saccharothrix sp.]|nr:helix-turn-helix transcriptional regulator [Saccharothrix sp.]
MAVVRKRLGHSQESSAEAVGVDVTEVGRWERGAQTPQPRGSMPRAVRAGSRRPGGRRRAVVFREDAARVEPARRKVAGVRLRSNGR